MNKKSSGVLCLTAFMAVAFLIMTGLTAKATDRTEGVSRAPGTAQERPADLTPEEITLELQNKYEATKSLKADFEQIASSEYVDKKRLGTGSVIVQKPNLIRWDYYLPERQILFSDGQTLSMYFEKSKQMIKTPAQQFLQSDVTYAFFTGQGNLARDFKVSSPNAGIEATEASYCIKLTPQKPHPQIDFFHLWISKKDFMMQRIQITDHLGSVTEIRFSNVLINPELASDRFYFTPPAGTEIIEQE